mmetsp:Transcript_10572/g.12142  ORF Transcript_10572/g.12142 Transcript_10572/m.12142 type:complete len:325 (-) Transcript_10572:88-1062(-)|eukprot:CAMPEP_0184013672 /NCGR_PEP_ID=MMETSP0954-20121128/5157_1 /TAXON_ID=627963 /ORGANISM="Aplanochytrium sp, Strain PBS07" /LENGTH=324 /DNA_ID=CAMNT_0026293915 /DNA_START=217 /DNA_END=1191 /DNA_ORIENTATION=-
MFRSQKSPRRTTSRLNRKGKKGKKSNRKAKEVSYDPFDSLPPPPPPPAEDEPPPPPLEEHPDMQQRMGGVPVLPSRNPNRKSVYDFSHTKDVYDSIENISIQKKKRGTNRSSNRYQGFSRPSRVSMVSGFENASQVSAGEEWGQLRSSGQTKGAVRKPANVAGPQADDHNDYIDFTVVPLLLRSTVDYNKAKDFGERLKQGYGTRAVKHMMTNFFALFEALERENLKVDQAIRQAVMEDAFWNSVGDESDGRASYIYYRDNSKNEPQSPRTKRQSFRERRASAMSQRVDFDQTYIETDDANESIDLDDAQFRKSMKVLLENFNI